MRISRIAICCAMVLAINPAVASSAPPRPTRAPGSIAVGALQSPQTGRVVATGIMRDAAGRPASGTVAINVLPNSSVKRTLDVGDVLPTRTVGWAKVGRNGTFSVRANTELIRSENKTGDWVDFEVVGWTGTRQAVGYVSASLAQGAAPARAHLTANQPLSPSAPASNRSARIGSDGDVEPMAPPIYCVWVLQDTYNAWVMVGETWPYGSDRGWMMTTTSHSMELGAAVSVSAGGNDWEASGTTTASSGITFTWAESTNDRSYREQHRYGRYRQTCGGVGYTNHWSSHQMNGTGGYTTATSSTPTFTSNRTPVSAGLWARISSSGNAYRLSGGVLIAGFLGINLSVDTEYDSSRVMYYRLSTPGFMYGDNASPAMASRIRTGR